MATDTAKIVEQLGKMTVLELVELKNALEEEWGVTAAAPVAVAAPGAPSGDGGGAAAEEQSAFDVVLTGAGRQEDPGDQGRSRDHRARAEGGQGPGRRRAERGQGGRAPRGGRLDQGPARGSGRLSRGQVARRLRLARLGVDQVARYRRSEGPPQGGLSGSSTRGTSSEGNTRLGAGSRRYRDLTSRFRTSPEGAE